MTKDNDQSDRSRAENLRETNDEDSTSDPNDPDEGSQKMGSSPPDGSAKAQEKASEILNRIQTLLDDVRETNGNDVDVLRDVGVEFLKLPEQTEIKDVSGARTISRQVATLCGELLRGNEEYAPTVPEMMEDALNTVRSVVEDSEGSPNFSVLEGKLDLFVGDDLIESPEDFPDNPETIRAASSMEPTEDNDRDKQTSPNNSQEGTCKTADTDSSKQPGTDELSTNTENSSQDYQFDPWDPSGKEALLEDYLAESREGLERLTNALIALEEEPSSDLIDEVFRVAHTLKGSSGMIGLEVMEELAHTMEELLDEVREGNREVTAEMIDLLLLCNDKIETILDTVAREEPVQVQIRHLLQGLEDYRKDGTVSLEDIRETEQSLEDTDSSEETNEGEESNDSTVSETIRVGTNKLDRVINLVGELTINEQQLDTTIEEVDQIQRELSRLVDEADRLFARNDLDSDINEELRLIHGAMRSLNQNVGQASKEISRVNTNLQDAVMETRMVPIAQLFQKFPRQVRDLARTEGKKVDFETRGDDTEMDKTVIEKIGDPLMHIIRNAIDHGIEPPEKRKQKGKPEEGKLVIEAGYEGDLAVIEIRDDGQGIHPEAVKKKAIENAVITEAEAEELSEQEAQELVFEPGFSTTEEVTETSGRGVGMDVVRSNITDLNGQVELESTVGEGSTFTIKLPLTLAIVQVLQIRCGRDKLALPLSSIRETLRISTERIDQIGRQEVVNLRGSTVTLLRLSDVLQLPTRQRNHQDIYPVIVAEWGDRRVGILVDEILEKQEVVIKDLGSVLNNVPFNSGATITGDGRVVLIVDLGRIVQRSEELSSETTPVPDNSSSGNSRRNEMRARVLVVDDSSTARTMITDALTQEGYEVEEATDGRDALEKIQDDGTFDLISTDIKMPHVDGYELVQELRTMDEYYNTPVVMVSSRDTQIDKMRGFEVGADDYLEKPFNAEEALGTFEELLDDPNGDSAAR